MCQRIFLLLLLLVNFPAVIHGLTNDKETSQPHRDIRKSVAKNLNTIDAASEERFQLKNLLRGFKRNPKAAKVFQNNPTFAKTLNKDPQLTMKVLRDPEVSKLGAALKKNPSLVKQPSVKKQIRGIAMKNVGKGGGVSTGSKISSVIRTIVLVLLVLAIRVGIPIGILVGVIAVAAT